MIPPKHMLVPVDVDPMSDRGLADRLVEDACNMAKAVGAKITLLHVTVPSLVPMLVTAEATGQAYQAMLDVMSSKHAACGRALKEAEIRASATGVSVNSELLKRDGNIPEIVLQYAKEIGADLLVLTTHGRRGLARMFLGSVAERTAHLAHIPVLLIPPR